MSATSSASLDARKFLLALLGDVACDRNFRRCFKAAHREVHQFFWQLKQRQESKPFVGELLFDTNGSYPHCEQLDELLQEFQLAGVLTRPNPTYRYNDIAITGSPSVEEFKAALSGELRNIYDRILDEFKRELGVPHTG